MPTARISLIVFLVLLHLGIVAQRTARAQQSQSLSSETANHSENSITAAQSELRDKFLAAKRIVFLGDSNTHAGEFITQIEATLLANHPNVPEIINLGLGSETCSGLSEPIHPFPRPDVHERVGRVLQKVHPDILIACYGMNDGIYHPFDEARFQKFKDGINDLIAIVESNNSSLILLTPPPFDSLPGKTNGKLVAKNAVEFSWKTTYENYDEEVIQPYADWIMTRSPMVAACIDTHTPLNQYLAERRITEPEFAFSNDGVHIDQTGHEVFAAVILRALGFEEPLTENSDLLKLVRERQSISHAAWLSEVGHLRPDVEAGLPLDEATKKIAPLTDSIKRLTVD